MTGPLGHIHLSIHQHPLHGLGVRGPPHNSNAKAIGIDFTAPKTEASMKKKTSVTNLVIDPILTKVDASATMLYSTGTWYIFKRL